MKLTEGVKTMTEAELKFIISRVVSNAFEALEEAKKDTKDQFASGRSLAYYEILDTIKNELTVREQDLKELGLDMNLEAAFIY